MHTLPLWQYRDHYAWKSLKTMDMPTKSNFTDKVIGSVSEKKRRSENQKPQQMFPDISQNCILNIYKLK
jgi:hypothetical protein